MLCPSISGMALGQCGARKLGRSPNTKNLAAKGMADQGLHWYDSSGITGSVMRQQDALTILVTHQSTLKDFGVKSLILFGSVARNEARPDSDVDLLVEFDRPVGLFTFVRLKRYLEEILETAVDLGTPDSLKPYLQEPVFREAIRAF